MWMMVCNGQLWCAITRCYLFEVLPLSLIVFDNFKHGFGNMLMVHSISAFAQCRNHAGLWNNREGSPLVVSILCLLKCTTLVHWQWFFPQ